MICVNCNTTEASPRSRLGFCTECLRLRQRACEKKARQAHRLREKTARIENKKCGECGQPLRVPRRRFCTTCIPIREARHDRESALRKKMRGGLTVAEWRSERRMAKRRPAAAPWHGDWDR